jgi:RNA polymerase sigma-70 factor (family 1)
LSINITPSDNELLEKVSRGEETAFAILYERYWKKIYTIALQYIKSPQASQDIVQEVFLKIWLKKENLLQIQHFKPYLFASARNLIISSLRSKVFHEYFSGDEPMEESTLLPERQLSFKESVELLHKAVQSLPPQQQRIYQMCKIEGMSYEETSKELGLSRLTVRNHLAKASDYIRKYLTDKGLGHAVLLFAVLFKK